MCAPIFVGAQREQGGFASCGDTLVPKDGNRAMCGDQNVKRNAAETDSWQT
jgi:hypothetical protein